MSAQIAVLEPQEVQEPGNGTRGHGRRLSRRELSLLIQLHEAGKTQTEISQVLDCAISTVCRNLDHLSDNRLLARKQLEAGAPKLVSTIIRSKDAATALKALGKLDVVREDQASSAAQVLVMVGSSSHLPALPKLGEGAIVSVVSADRPRNEHQGDALALPVSGESH